MKTYTLCKEQVSEGSLILVNSSYPLTTRELPGLTQVHPEYPDVRISGNVMTSLSKIMEDLHCEDQIVPVSGYRSREEQETIYEESLQENGKEFTMKYVALPDHSEHQTGLAIDLGKKEETIDFIRPEFPYTGICQTFRKLAPRYGFIERYPQGKEPITGIACEPWHFRFVGVPHGDIMQQMDLTLEEYLCFIKKYPIHKTHFKWEDEDMAMDLFYVPAEDEPVKLTFPSEMMVHISGNNIDGFIVTVSRYK
ncbi:D-alanyl-D-alanine carboxypeptidase family protein [Anaerolentibacter hominis]|uniref:D-alanyl-D-alanine carboxypeptidase family protein n=1 Tax=Anaerolentibacter hominis TaxID=3079009 RepID=UPI0031B88EFA